MEGKSLLLEEAVTAGGETKRFTEGKMKVSCCLSFSRTHSPVGGLGTMRMSS